MSTKVKRHFFKLALLLGALLICELTCRFSMSENKNISFKQLQQDLQHNPQFNSFANSIENDTRLFWKLKPSITLTPTGPSRYRGLISNSQGLREPLVISPLKPQNEKRFLFIGDSCTFGYGLLEHETFVAQFEQGLNLDNQNNKEQPPITINAINAGVPGYSLFQGKEFVKQHLNTLNPDALIVTFGWNDQNLWSSLSDEERATEIIKQIPPTFLQHSRLAQFIWKSSVSNDRPKKVRVSTDSFYSYLEELYQICENKNIKMALIVWPFQYNLDPQKDPKTRGEWQIIQYAFAENHPNCQLIDLVPLFQRLHKKYSSDQLFMDEGHATKLGAQLISEELLDKLKKR